MLCLSAFIQGNAQVPYFVKLFNDTDSTHQYWNTNDIIQSSADSGYIGVGFYQNTVTFNNTPEYFKLDKNGDVIWVKELPEYSSADINQIIKSQHGYLLAANYNQSTIMEIDEQGNKLWGRQFSTPIRKFIKNAAGYMGVGSVDSNINVVQLDTLGNILWQKQFSYNVYASTQVFVRNILQDNAGNCYFHGYIGNGQGPNPVRSWDGLLVKIDQNGNHLWSKYYSSIPQAMDQISSTALDSEYNILIAGLSRDTNNVMEGFIAKINSSGSVINAKKSPLANPSYIFKNNGNTMNCTLTTDDVNTRRLVELDSALNIISQKEFIFNGISTVKATFDNRLMVSGQYLLNTATNEYRSSVIKVSRTDSSCIDTIVPDVSLSPLAFSFSDLTQQTSNPGITVSNFTTDPVSSTLNDTAFCIGPLYTSVMQQRHELTVYPNPTNDIITISGKVERNDIYELILTNLVGQVISKEFVTITAGVIDKKISLKNLSCGVYFLSIGSRNVRQVFKINKQ